MKTQIAFLSTLLLALSAQAAPKTDCSQAAQGKVTITTVGSRLKLDKGAEIAYRCFQKAENSIVVARAAAIRKAQEQSGNEDQCGFPDKLQLLILESWTSERPSISVGENEEMNAVTGGGTTFLVREPFLCGGLGTGLFGGIVSSVSASIDVEESYNFRMDDTKKPAKQILDISFKGLIDLKPTKAN